MINRYHVLEKVLSLHTRRGRNVLKSGASSEKLLNLILSLIIIVDNFVAADDHFAEMIMVVLVFDQRLLFSVIFILVKSWQRLPLLEMFIRQALQILLE